MVQTHLKSIDYCISGGPKQLETCAYNIKSVLHQHVVKRPSIQTFFDTW